MNRKIKNIICCIAIVILIGAIGFTIYLAKTNLTINVDQKMVGENTQMETPPEMPDGAEQNGETPPEKPDGDEQNGETPPEKPDGDEQNGETPPDMPDGTEQTGETPPEMPEGESNNETTNDQNNVVGEMPNNFNMNSNMTISLTTSYYIILGIESLLLSLIIIYLIQSKFNYRSIKETYSNKDKIIIGILTTIISTGVLTFGISYLTNNLILKSSTNNQMSDGMNNSSNNITYSTSSEITESSTISNKEYTSTTADENALSISGDIEVTASDITVTKTGDSDGGDNTSFYGINSAIIAKDGAILNLKNINITTDATGANGVFSYGGSATTNNSSSDGTTINISDSTITTKKDNSGGIMTTGGGITNATNLTITTAGTSSAAIRTDRGGGTVTVDGGTYKTTGQGSPSIYSTAEVTVKNANLESTTSEGIVIEGKNSVSIENVELTDTNNKLNGQSTTYKNIFLYQSMSGDADDGTSSFTAKDSTITTNKGDSFYITNTTSKILLTNNTITNNDSTGNFLRAQADSWGTSGSNGGIVTLIMNNQKINGNIVIDSISTLDLTMKSSSSYTGTINNSNSAKNIKITLDKTSKIKLTGDSYISSLDNADSTNSNIDFNNYKLYVDGKAIN